MDDLTRAIYRAGCLVAAAHNAESALELRDLVDRANDLFELYVSELERHPDVLPQIAPTTPEAEREILERLRAEVAVSKEARDKEKMARAAAMVDEEHMQRDQNEEPLEVRRP